MTKYKILIIEDQEMIQFVYEEIFRQTEHTIVFSLDMQEILGRMPEVDIVLSDYNMGLDFNRIALEAERLSKPFLAVTGEGRFARRVHKNQLDKPFSPHELLEAMESVMRDSQLNKSLSQTR